VGLHVCGRVHAILAPRLPYLRSAAPEWFADRQDRIFGDAAPDRLGPATFDLYLEWGTPYPQLVQDQRDRQSATRASQRSAPPQ